MPRWLKVLLIVAIVVVLGIVAVVGAGAYWWMKNKDALLAQAKEGKDFGRQTDNQGCVDGTLSRYKKEPGLVSAMSNSIFLRSCLEASRPTPGFCDSVPHPTEFMKTAEWQLDQCRHVNLSEDNYCRQLFQPIQQFCEHGARDSSPGENANRR